MVEPQRVELCVKPYKDLPQTVEDKLNTIVDRLWAIIYTRCLEVYFPAYPPHVRVQSAGTPCENRTRATVIKSHVLFLLS